MYIVHRHTHVTHCQKHGNKHKNTHFSKDQFSSVMSSSSSSTQLKFQEFIMMILVMSDGTKEQKLEQMFRYGLKIFSPNILEMILKGFWHWWKWMDQRGGGFPGIESQTQKYLSKLWNSRPSHKLACTLCGLLLFQLSGMIIGGKASLPPSSGPSKKTWTWKGDIFWQHLAFRDWSGTAL